MEKPVHKILTIPLRIALVILLYGSLFKFMRWPYAQTLMLFGNIAILILYSIRFLFIKDKLKLDYIKLSLVLVWVFSYIVSAFHLFNMPYVFEIVLLILFVWWFIEEGLTYFTRRKLVDSRFVKFLYYLLLITSLTLVIVGALFKIQHWPYGAILFTFGVLMLSLVLILDLFVIKSNQSPN